MVLVGHGTSNPSYLDTNIRSGEVAENERVGDQGHELLLAGRAVVLAKNDGSVVIADSGSIGPQGSCDAQRCQDRKGLERHVRYRERRFLRIAGVEDLFPGSELWGVAEVEETWRHTPA